MPKRILLFEPSAGGHELYHVRLIAEAAQDAGLPVTFATTEKALAHPSAQPLLALLDKRGSEVLVTRPDMNSYTLARRIHPVVQQQFACCSALRKTLRANGGRRAFGHVFVPFFDAYMTLILGLRMQPCLGIPMSGILHRTRFHMPAMGIRTSMPFHVRIEKYVYASMLRRRDVRRLFTMDKSLSRYFNNDRIVFLPDPAEYHPTATRDSMRTQLGIAPGTLCILVYGMLDSRKAIDTLLRGVQQMAQPGRLCLVIAGWQDEHVREILASPLAEDLRSAGIVREIPGFVEVEVVDNLFLAIDVCWICYRNSDANSGVMVKAGRAGRPVVTARTGISAKIAADDGLGWQADPNDPAVVAAVLQSILDDPAARSKAADAIRRRFEENTTGNFVGPIIDYLRSV